MKLGSFIYDETRPLGSSPSFSVAGKMGPLNEEKLSFESDEKLSVKRLDSNSTTQTLFTGSSDTLVILFPPSALTKHEGSDTNSISATLFTRSSDTLAVEDPTLVYPEILRTDASTDKTGDVEQR